MAPERNTLPQEGRDYLRFSHEAMATTFEILISAQDPTYAAQAATACFAQLDDLERQLSRYLSHSDISQLNRAPVGESVVLGIEALACLQQAQRLYEITGGALDVTIGRWTRDSEEPNDRGTEGRRDRGRGFGLQLDSEGMTATRLHGDVSVDLGAMGKGFALEHLKGILIEWKIERAMLHGGSSTVLALDAPMGYAGWPITISHPLVPNQVIQSLSLRQTSLSGSSQEHHSHILNPHTGEPVTDVLAAWARCPHAAWADGLSTAFMILSSIEFKRVCENYAGIEGVRILATGEIEGLIAL